MDKRVTKSLSLQVRIPLEQVNVLNQEYNIGSNFFCNSNATLTLYSSKEQLLGGGAGSFNLCQQWSVHTIALREGREKCKSGLQKKKTGIVSNR